MRLFPYGKAAFCLFLLGVVAGAWLLFNPPQKKKATLTFWTFAKPHYEAYQKALPAFEKEHPGVTVDLQLVSGTGLPQRLRAAFQADLDVPDMVEIEISAAGTFFRGPVDHVGFMDLTDRLKREGLDKRIIAARFAPYTNRGRIFGLPHDVHPVMLAYNRELFAKNGLDPSQLKTWDQFIAAGKKVLIPGKQYLIEMSDSGGSQIEMCLFQRDGGYFDPDGKVIFDSDVAAETMKWYVPLVAQNSKDKIAGSLSSSFGQVMTQALEDGYFLTVVTPDWRSKNHQLDVGKLKGKMGLMPLPAVTAGGRPTSTWGGTMLGIARKSKHPDLAWEFAKHLYLNDKDLANRFADTNILPPVPSAWKEPAFDQPFEYYAGQKIGRDYANLAPQVPFQYTSPYIDLAKAKFTEAMISCIQYYNANGDKGFDAFIRQTLRDKADEVRKQMARNPL